MNNLPEIQPLSEKEAMLQIHAEKRKIELVWYSDTLIWVLKDDWIYQHVRQEHRNINQKTFARPVVRDIDGPDIIALKHILSADENPLLLDIGCNYGLQAVRMLRVAKSIGRRPVLKLFDPGIAGKLSLLNLVLNGFDPCDYYHVAVSDIDGYLSVHIVEGQSQDNKIINPGKDPLSLPVRSVTLNNILDNNPGHESAFIKIDTQGAEFEIFNGFKNSNFRDRFISVMEFFPNGLATRVKPKDFLKSLCNEFIIYDIGAARKYAYEVTGKTIDDVFERLNRINPPFTDLIVIAKGITRVDALRAQLEQFYRP